MKFFAILREIIGWALLGIGLAAFGLAGIMVLRERMICSGMILTGIGYIVFRGGLHLIKVAVAARAAADGRYAAAGPLPPRQVRRPVVVQRPLAEVRPSVLPGPGKKAK